VGQIGVKVTVRAKAKGYKSNSRNVRSGKIGLSYNFYGPLFYGSFLEFGTSHQPAYPYMRPAFEENKNTLPGIIRDELAKAIDATVRRLKK
jgi:HK97 gp10 family phage protein